jgi:amino acid adenylation domain-containing protein
MAFSLNHLLVQTAGRYPENPALRFNGQDLSYAALVQRASAIGHRLLAEGLKRQERVAVYMNRSFDSMAAIFGIMMAGGVYVPFDSFAPPGRLAAILRDCEVQGIISDDTRVPAIRQMLAEYSGLRFLMGVEAAEDLKLRTINWADLYRTMPSSPPQVRAVEQDLCLIFYTSGTTGNPKGAAHSHRSMLSNVEWAMEKYRLLPEDRFSNVTSHHFDLSWFEMYASMASGGTLVIAPEQTVRFAPDLAELVSREKLTIWCSVPSVLMSLAQRGNLASRDFSTLRWIMFAGERYPTKHLRQLMKLVPHPRYTNMYGTTETHIAAYWDVPPLADDNDEPIPIGQGCEHVNLLVVDPDGKAVGPGQTGELVIRGPSLMEGYWRLPERNARALVKIRFSPELEATCYRSGDLVEILPDGNIKIIGRADRRVKVRGNLVDLDEVEKVMLSHPQVSEAGAYLIAPDEDNTWIEAAVIPHPGAPVSSSELRVHVARTLPTYAVPEKVAVLVDFPRTGSGKLSRRDLQNAAAAQAVPAVPPHISIQEAVRRYIQTELVDSSEKLALAEDTELLDSGLITSIGVVRLVAYLEETFGVVVPNDEFIAENFTDLAAINQMIERLRKPQ